MSAGSYDGSCYCGRVRYRIEPPIKFIVHDHCSMCRRISGAAFVTWCGVARDQFALLGGEAELSTFASSPEATRQFCRHCGSHLFFRSSQWPGDVHVTLATLLAPDGLVPTAHVYWSDKAPWLDLEAALPRRGGASGVERIELG